MNSLLTFYSTESILTPYIHTSVCGRHHSRGHSHIVYPDILHTFPTLYSDTLYTYLSDILFYTLQTVTEGIHAVYLDILQSFLTLYPDTLCRYLSDILF